MAFFHSRFLLLLFSLRPSTLFPLINPCFAHFVFPSQTAKNTNMALAKKLALFCLLLACFSALIPATVAGEKDSETEADAQKTSSKKRNGAEPAGSAQKQSGNGNETATTTATPTTIAPCQCSTEQPPPAGEDNGFGAGSIFVAILFGMGLMFALGHLYTFWEKRRLLDSPNYRGY